MKKPFLLSALFGATAVALGALGAHALKNKLSTGLITPDQLNAFDTAARYQMYHAIAMILVLVIANYHLSGLFKWAYYFFVAGILLFSGSLYFLSTRGLLGMEGLKALGPITPLGGICFVAGWLCLAWAGITKTKTQ